MFASGVERGQSGTGVCRIAGLSTGLVGAEMPGRPQPTSMNQNQTPMNQVIHFVGLDVHKESVAVSIAPTADSSGFGEAVA